MREAALLGFPFLPGPKIGGDSARYSNKICVLTAQMETKSASGVLEDVRELRDLKENTFAILANLLAIPLISSQRKHAKIGILFEGSARANSVFT